MKLFNSVTDPQVIELLQSGAVGIIRTDTLYGVIGRAADKNAVERVYSIKHRSPHKALIVLIGSTSQLFDVPPAYADTVLSQVWPGKTSVILPANDAPSWIPREGGNIAYRLPADSSLQQMLQETGPLVAPSANPEGRPPARSVEEAVVYFGESVDFYVDGGEVIDDTPSQLIRVAENGQTERLR